MCGKATPDIRYNFASALLKIETTRRKEVESGFKTILKLINKNKGGEAVWLTDHLQEEHQIVIPQHIKDYVDFERTRETPNYIPNEQNNSLLTPWNDQKARFKYYDSELLDDYSRETTCGFRCRIC